MDGWYVCISNARGVFFLLKTQGFSGLITVSWDTTTFASLTLISPFVLKHSTSWRASETVLGVDNAKLGIILASETLTG